MKGCSIAVVVAAHRARASVEACLEALAAQQSDEETEILVIENGADGTAAIVRERFPGVRLVAGSPSALIPELWSAGIRQTAADIVALTTAHCVPDQNWLAAIRKAHEAPAAAVGGAIENDRAARVVDWAIYFCRYSRYMLPFQPGYAEDIAGDNASYKRAAIDRCRHTWQHGFWEPAVHRALKKEGARLLLTPAVVVHHKKSFGFWGFLRQRFRHGLEFGSERVSHHGARKQVLYVVAAPAVPFLLLGRITRQVLLRRRNRRQFLVCLPFLLLFLLAWTGGELTGYLRGRKG